MIHGGKITLALLLVAGCQSSTTIIPSGQRLKRFQLPDSPVVVTDGYLSVDGDWVPESSDPGKALGLPEQVTIECIESDGLCHERTITLGITGETVEIMGGIEQKEWKIDSWNNDGLLASYGPYIHAGAASERCQSHVLAMTFKTGAVSTSDIPTHTAGCEAFKETDSYRLAQGNYYVDTTPANDSDKPHPAK